MMKWLWTMIYCNCPRQQSIILQIILSKKKDLLCQWESFFLPFSALFSFCSFNGNTCPYIQWTMTVLPVTNMQRDGGTEQEQNPDRNWQKRKQGRGKWKAGSDKEQYRCLLVRSWTHTDCRTVTFPIHAFPARLSSLQNTKQLLEQRECAAPGRMQSMKTI